MSKQIKNNKDIYKPYKKDDFKDLYYNEDNEMFESFKIIRQLTEKEKQDFEKGNDYDEEMYLIENFEGEDAYVFDTEILKDYELPTYQWHKSLIHMIGSMEYNDDLMEQFLKYCKIENFIKKYYEK